MQCHTVCRLCSACCPVTVTVEAGKMVRAARKSFLPEEKRLSCPKLAAAPEIVYSPARILRPLIRSGPGNGFHEASWDEALGRVAERFNFFRRTDGAQSIAWLRGMAADWGAPWDYACRLMNAFGSPNTIGNGSVCHVAREMAHAFTYGAMTLPQPRNSRCILIWGKNDRNTAPGVCEQILHARSHGARLIVVDPIRTSFAQMADIWLQIKPGHDGPLAMAMLNEIIINNLYDAAFVDQYGIGFDELRAAVAHFSPDLVAADLWLDPEDIRRAARLYATTRPACIIDGNGLDMQLSTFQATRAVCMLRAVTGNIDREGGDLIPQPIPLKNIQLKERLPKDVQPVTAAYPLFDAFHPTWGRHAQSCLIDAILGERPYPIRMLVVQSGNPAVTMTDAKRVRRALQKLDFLVVIDLFRNRTAEMADVILPAASCFEKTQLNRASMRSSPVVLQNQVIDCLGESRPDWQIVFELGRRLGLEADFPWASVEAAIDEQLSPSGLTVAFLRENPDGLWTEPTKFEKYRSKGFATPSGRVEFHSDRLARAGHAPVPFAEGTFEDLPGSADACNADVVIGISGERTNRFTHTQFLRIPSLARQEPEGFVDIHPRDAAARGISDGQEITISNERGQVRMKARISDVVHPGSIRIAWGWGEIDPDANVNNLTDDNRRDPITATPSNRSFLCRIET